MRTMSAPATITTQEIIPLVSVFDPGSSPETMETCLDRYFSRVSAIRVLIGHSEHYKGLTTSETMNTARRFGIPTVTRVDSSAWGITRGILPIYLDLCAETGVSRIQLREHCLQPETKPWEVVSLAKDRNLDIQFEIEDSNLPRFATKTDMTPLIGNTAKWLDAGAVNLVADVTKVHPDGKVDIDIDFAEHLAAAFGLGPIMFKARIETTQHEMFAAFGPEVHLSEVHFEHIATVEKMRMEAISALALQGHSSQQAIHRSSARPR